MPIIIKETIPGCGSNWYTQDIRDRSEWIHEHFKNDEYRCWYGGLKSDDFYIQFLDDQHALAYKLKWCIK